MPIPVSCTKIVSIQGTLSLNGASIFPFLGDAAWGVLGLSVPCLVPGITGNIRLGEVGEEGVECAVTRGEGKGK